MWVLQSYVCSDTFIMQVSVSVVYSVAFMYVYFLF